MIPNGRPIGPTSRPVAAPVKLPPLVSTIENSAPKAKVMMMKWWPLTRKDGRPRRPATSAEAAIANGSADQKPMPRSLARMAAV